MRSLIMNGDGTSTDGSFTRGALGATAGRNERWLQQTLFAHPDLLPLEDIDPSLTQLVPICTEFRLPRAGGDARVDILAVTKHGRLVLVECKLWRNPEARREVVGQIFEYASLLRGLRYSDLESRLGKQGLEGRKPLFEAVKKTFPDVAEEQFVDRVSACLATGDFALIIAGDGIRSDLHAVGQMLNLHTGLLARLAFVEIRPWIAADGRVLLVPNVLARTDVIQHRIIVGVDGRAVEVAEAGAPPGEGEREISPGAEQRRAMNRAFWQRFIDEMSFDHQEQPKPRHGGNNWVRIPFPEPASGITAYRSEGKNVVGFFFTLPGEGGARVLERIREEQQQLAAETGLPITFEEANGTTFVEATCKLDAPEVAGTDNQLAWLKRGANALVIALRPRFSQWTRGSQPIA